MTSIRTIPTLALTLLASSGFASATEVSLSVVHVDLMDPSTSTSINGMMIKTDTQTIKGGAGRFRRIQRLENPRARDDRRGLARSPRAIALR